MEVHFEYQIECEEKSDGEFKTIEDAIKSANNSWQEVCDSEDGYEHGRGDGFILIINSDDGEMILKSPIILDCQLYLMEKPYLQSEFL